MKPTQLPTQALTRLPTHESGGHFFTRSAWRACRRPATISARPAVPVTKPKAAAQSKRNSGLSYSKWDAIDSDDDCDDAPAARTGGQDVLGIPGLTVGKISDNDPRVEVAKADAKVQRLLMLLRTSVPLILSFRLIVAFACALVLCLPHA